MSATDAADCAACPAAAAGFLLLVDDDDDTRAILATRLRLAGYRVEAVVNGREALAVIAAGRRPCLIVLDLAMPVMDGWQFMAFRREALAAIGGLEVAEGQLVDDMFLGERVAAAGYQNLVSPHPVPVVQRGLGTWPFVRIYRRWITFSRSGLPGRDFKLISWLRGALFWAGVVGAVGAVIVGAPIAAAVLGLGAVALAASVARLHARFGGAPLAWPHAWVAFATLLGALAVYLSIFVRRQVSWRGRTYQLTAASRLAADRAQGNELALAASAK